MSSIFWVCSTSLIAVKGCLACNVRFGHIRCFGCRPWMAITRSSRTGGPTFCKGHSHSQYTYKSLCFLLTRAQALLAAQILWGTAIALVKIALLLFYRRIFVTKRFQIADNIMLGITVSWFLTFFIVSVITNSFLI